MQLLQLRHAFIPLRLASIRCPLAAAIDCGERADLAALTVQRRVCRWDFGTVWSANGPHAAELRHAVGHELCEAAADGATPSNAIRGLGKIRICQTCPMITIDSQIFKPELRESI